MVNRAAMSMTEQASVEQEIKSFEHLPKSGIAGSDGRFGFSFLRILCPDFHSGCTGAILPTVTKGSHSLHYCQHLLSVVLLIFPD